VVTKTCEFLSENSHRLVWQNTVITHVKSKDSKTTGNDLTLVNLRTHYSLQKHSFTSRVVTTWHS